MDRRWRDAIDRARMPSAVSGCNCRISDRDSSGATTENDGFSVVAATSSTTRFSTAASSASCWVLENRCTSSMNSTVCSPCTAAPARDVDHRADLLDPGRQRRQRLEAPAGGLRDQRCQRRLAGARWAVEDDRRRTRPVDQPAQRRVRAAAGGPGRRLRRATPGASAPPAGRSRPRPPRPPSRPVHRRARRTDRRTRSLLTTPSRHDGGAVRVPRLRDEVDQLLDAADQRRLEVVPVPHPAADPLPRRGDVGLLAVRPAAGPRTRRVSSPGPSGSMGQAASPSRAGLTACQMSMNGCPTTSVCAPPGPRRTASAIRASLEPATRWSTSTPSRRPGPGRNSADDGDQVVDAAQVLDHHALDAQIVAPHLLDQFGVVAALDVDPAGKRHLCPGAGHRDGTRCGARGCRRGLASSAR